MKIEQIHLKNFRAFKDVTMKNIPKFVVIIGSNGSGKAVINEMDEVEEESQLKREDQKLKSPDILAIKGLAQFERFPAAVALGNLIEKGKILLSFKNIINSIITEIIKNSLGEMIHSIKDSNDFLRYWGNKPTYEQNDELFSESTP